eukprot:scaffold11713_cov139-Skeletonema_menzelii.AAC.1
MADEMEQQLQKLGRSINDATREAYDVMIASSGTIVGDIFADKENNRNNKNDDDGGMSNRDGMEMGLALFGTTDAYKLQMDEEFRGKLSAVEKELDEIFEGLQSLREDENHNGQDIVGIEEGLDSGHNPSDDGDILSIDDIPHMQHHIQFLQQCAQAKTLLGHVEKLSFSNFTTSSVVSGTGTESNDQENKSSVFLLSPSAQFSFRPTSDVLEEGESPMVQAARLIKEVDSILESATLTLKDESVGSSRLIRLRAKIFNELQTEACRFKSELKHRAMTLIERCIVVEEDKISVRGSGTAKKAVKFNMNSSADVTGDISSSPLSDAFEVLDSFSDHRFASFGETLDIAMKEMARKITGAIKARMATFDSALASGEVAMFTMREEYINNTRRNDGNQYYDFTNVGGASIQLSWASTNVQYEEQVGNDAGDSSTSVISTEINETVIKSAPSASIASFMSLLKYITTLLVFVHDHALLSRTELSNVLGKYIFRPPSSEFTLSVVDEGSLITDLLEAMRRWCIPEESSPQVWKMVKTVEHRLINEVGVFEDAMAKLNFLNGSNVDDTDTSASVLSKLAKSSCQAYVETQRCRIINTGRDLLLNSDYHNTSRVGHIVKDPAEPGSLDSLNDDPQSAFLLQECSVSVVAQEVLRLCRKTLEDASDHDAALTIDTFPSSMYRASREVLDLFRAIIPTRYGKEIASIPRFAAVLHNDCVFLAHSCAFLGAEYKEKISKLASSMDESSRMKMLSEVCTFVDLVPPFRDLASKSMGSMIEMQKVQLYELISPRLTASFTIALGSNESVSEWDDAETALKAAIHHLCHLSQTWKNVLTRNVYNIAMGNLVDTVFVLFLEPVLKAPELSEPATQFMHYLYLEAAKSAAELFHTDGSAEVLFKIAAKYAVEFEKLQSIGQFMVMRLDDIQRWLEQGKFKSVKAKELSHLVTATFDESEKRRSLLNSLTPK